MNDTEYEINENHDEHYAKGSTQPIQFLQENLTGEQFEGAMLFNISKYVSRFGKKTGSLKVDEARKILNYAIALYTHELGDRIDPMKQFYR